MKLDWKEFAEINGLNPQQFTKEVMTMAAVVGGMQIDPVGADSYKFVCTDNVGDISVTVERVK